MRNESDEIMHRIAEVYRSGAAPDSDAAMDAVEAHRLQINQRFYECTRERQVQLGEMYVSTCHRHDGQVFGDHVRFGLTGIALATAHLAWGQERVVLSMRPCRSMTT